MATVKISLTPSSLKVVKRALVSAFPAMKSSHISEALAAAVGCRTHAALLLVLQLCTTGGVAAVASWPDWQTFIRRLGELSGEELSGEIEAGEEDAFSVIVRMNTARSV